MTKLEVKELRDVPCPYCGGQGSWRECYGDYIYEGDCGLGENMECAKCDKTGIVEIVVEYCNDCGEELEWDDREFGFDDETESMFRCLVNKCDL